jgi:APA family basic amino acid/polyamine antiporter
MTEPQSDSVSTATLRVERELPRRLGVLSAAAVVIGTTIGSGIFRTPAVIADRLPGPLPMMAIWVAAGAFVLCGALTLAEMAGSYPRSGGPYVFIREAFGRVPAFLFGWTQLVLVRAAALGGIATVFAEYALRMFGFDPGVAPYSGYVHFVGAGAIVLVGIFNYVGVQWGALVQNLTTVAKYGALLVIVIFAFALGLPATGGHYTPAAPPGSFSMAPFGLAMVSVLWAYDGWADVSFVSGEVKDPRRNLPIAIIGGTLAIIFIYLLANMAYLAVMPVAEMRQSPLVAADVAQQVMGTAGLAFVGITVVVSTFGTLNGSMLAGPRTLFALADHGSIFKPLGRVHPRFDTPHVAIIVASVLGVIFVSVAGFEALADAFVTAMVPFYALAVGAVYRVRGRPGYDPPFRVPGYPLVPALFILASLYLLANALIDPSSRWATAAVLAVILAGIPVFYMTREKREQAVTES